MDEYESPIVVDSASLEGDMAGNPDARGGFILIWGVTIYAVAFIVEGFAGWSYVVGTNDVVGKKYS